MLPACASPALRPAAALDDFRLAYDSCITAHCSGRALDPSKHVACASARRLQAALSDAASVATRHHQHHRPRHEWAPLEGRSVDELLRKHPDPLGALQRGDVPALILRGVLGTSDLRSLRQRLAVFGAAIARADHNPEMCNLLELADHQLDHAQQHEPAAAIPLQPPSPLPSPPTSIPSARPRNAKASCSYSTKASVCLLGVKLYGHFRRGARDTYLRQCAAHNAILQNLSAACPPGASRATCTPQAAMLAGVRELARPGGRSVRVASQQPSSRQASTTIPAAATAATAATVATAATATTATTARSSSSIIPSTPFYSAGVLNFHRPGFFYPLHFDAINAHAWTVLRSWVCAEDVPADRGYAPARVSDFSVARHAFSTAAILTLQSPDRRTNPYDLRVYRARWPALLANCSVRSATAYGIGQRLDEATWPEAEVPYVDLHGDEGDLYLFNSEHAHRTPVIRGDASRVVFSSIVGFSSLETAPGARDVEVWG